MLYGCLSRAHYRVPGAGVFNSVCLCFHRLTPLPPALLLFWRLVREQRVQAGTYISVALR